MEKRRNRRYPKRTRVRYGEGAFTHTGFTSDISATGLFLVTSHMLPVGTRLHVEVAAEGERLVFFEGLVARQKMVAPELRQVMRAGMGVRLLTPSELLGELVPQVRDKEAAQLVVTFESPEKLKDSYERELKRGGLFIWSDTPQLANSVMTIELEFAFAGRSVTAHARVVHTMPEQNGRHGVALMFIDSAAVVAGVEAALAEQR
jgi:hypothetical protein